MAPAGKVLLTSNHSASCCLHSHSHHQPGEGPGAGSKSSRCWGLSFPTCSMSEWIKYFPVPPALCTPGHQSSLFKAPSHPDFIVVCDGDPYTYSQRATSARAEPSTWGSAGQGGGRGPGGEREGELYLWLQWECSWTEVGDRLPAPLPGQGETVAHRATASAGQPPTATPVPRAWTGHGSRLWSSRRGRTGSKHKTGGREVAHALRTVMGQRGWSLQG